MNLRQQICPGSKRVSFSSNHPTLSTETWHHTNILHLTMRFDCLEETHSREMSPFTRWRHTKLCVEMLSAFRSNCLTDSLTCAQRTPASSAMERNSTERNSQISCSDSANNETHQTYQDNAKKFFSSWRLSDTMHAIRTDKMKHQLWDVCTIELKSKFKLIEELLVLVLREIIDADQAVTVCKCYL